MYFSRGLNKAVDPYTMPDFYEAYIKEVEESDGPYQVSYATYRDICEEYYKELMEYLFEGGLYIFPYNVGEISIKGMRPKNFNSRTLTINWEETNKIGKRVYHLNDHSNHFKYRFSWSKKDKHIKHKTDYRLVFTRDNKRRLAKIIKSGNYNYFSHD